MLNDLRYAFRQLPKNPAEYPAANKGHSLRQILTLMLGEAMVPVAAGLGVGLVVSAELQRVLWSQGSMAPGWEPNTPLLFALVIGAFGLVALLASCSPAHRATRVDPMITLRHE